MAQGMAEESLLRSRPPVSFSFCSLACGTPASMSVPGENVSVPGQGIGGWLSVEQGSSSWECLLDYKPNTHREVSLSLPTFWGL